MHLLNTVMNWCAYMQDFDDTLLKKHVRNVKVIPYENKTIAKIEKKKKDKHPWDITQEIMLEQKQAALAVKWAIIPLEVLMDEQFLNVLHAIEEITDATPLREAAKQLPKQIYEIIAHYLKKVIKNVRVMICSSLCFIQKRGLEITVFLFFDFSF